MNELLIGLFGGGAMAAIVSGVVQVVIWKLNRKAKENDEREGTEKHIKIALMLLMHDRIKYLGKCYIKDGSICAEDLKDIMSMHACYHDDLGGNGFLDNIMGQVKDLHIEN